MVFTTRAELAPISRRRLELPVEQEGYAFNPAIFRSGAGLTCIYRHVGVDGTRSLRRCALDGGFIAGEAAAWSDEAKALGGGVSWYADPRVFLYRGRWHVTFNTGHSEFPNNIYVAEVDESGRPVTAPRSISKVDGRQGIEKNWGFFEHEGELFCVYSISPFVILRVDGDGSARVYAKHRWHSEALEQAYGRLRGEIGRAHV